MKMYGILAFGNTPHAHAGTCLILERLLREKARHFNVVGTFLFFYNRMVEFGRRLTDGRCRSCAQWGIGQARILK